MEETTVNRLNGIPFWGHGTMENLENGITPNETETQDQVREESENGNGDVGVQEQEPSLGKQDGSESEVAETSDSDSAEPVGSQPE